MSEDYVNSIGTSIFRRSFEEFLDQNNLKYLDAAEEMADGWYYYFYNPNEFPSVRNRKRFFIDNFSRNHPAK